MSTDLPCCPRCRRPCPYQAEAFNGPYCECPPPPQTFATDTTTMTTPHDQAIREAADRLIEHGSTVAAFDNASTARSNITPILRDLVAKAGGEGAACAALLSPNDACDLTTATKRALSREAELRAQPTAAQADVKRMREERDEARCDYESLVCLLKKRFPARDGVLPDFAVEDVLRENTTIRAAAEQAIETLNHGIPYHAYGENEAAVEMGNRMGTALTALSAALQSTGTVKSPPN